MTPKERAVMQEALEALRYSCTALGQMCGGDACFRMTAIGNNEAAMEKMREALEQPVSQEPVICTECGQPTMHEGSKCYACCQKDTRELEDALRASAPQPVKEVPEGYALISIDALKAWGKYDEVRNACQFPAEQAEQEPVAEVDTDSFGCINWLKTCPDNGEPLYTAPQPVKLAISEEVFNWIDANAPLFVRDAVQHVKEQK